MAATLVTTHRSAITRELQRRLAACKSRRRLAALSPGDDVDFATWTHEVRRQEKLETALFYHLTRSPQTTMNATQTAAATMSKPLTSACQNAILSQYQWTPSGKIRVQCTHRTEPLLRKAGVHRPKPFEFYEVKVRRNEAGFLVLNHYAEKTPLIESSDDSLFAPGGIFAGETPPPAAPTNILPLPRREIPPEIAPELANLCEIPATRTFEIPTGPHSKIRIQIIAFEDESLPAPNERERWTPHKPSAPQIHAAIAALHMARDLAHFEQL